MFINRTILSILAGLGGMFGWGTSDFLANSASERVGHLKTFFWSQIAGVILLFILLSMMMPSFSTEPYLLALTIVSGIAYAFGYLLFYKGFEIGNVSVVSAVVNLHIIFIIGISFLRGQTLTRLQLPAISLLLVGVLLVSVNLQELRNGSLSLLKGVKETLLATIFFGVIYWPLNEFIVEKTDWLAVTFNTKLIAIITVFIISLLKRQSLKIANPSGKLSSLIVAVGILESFGVLSMSFGQSYGDGIIVSPISSALTVVTVGLAVIILKERISKIQSLGILLVVIGIIMTAL